MIATLFRLSLLLFAIVLLLIGLLTTFAAPTWIDWRMRMMLAVFAPEAGMWLSILPLLVGVAALFLRRGSPWISYVTIGCALLAAMLMIKPVFQALRLSRALPSQLTEAFGPAQPRQTPFFMSPVFHGTLPESPVKTLNYSGSLLLDFYSAAGRSPAPCVICMHGGAWCSGDRRQSIPFNHRLAQLGYAVADIDYRLAPAAIWPAQRDDVLAAIAFLRTQSSELGIDPQRFVLLGRSAGGQLALAAGYGQHDPGIRGVIDFYGPTDMAASLNATSPSDVQLRKFIVQFLGGSPTQSPAAYDSASAMHLATKDAPPTLLLHGGLDTVVNIRQSELLNEKLRTLGIPHALVLIPWAGHGFDFARNGPSDRLSNYAIEFFLSAVTR
jgi:acetyl esterase/lipase